MNLPQLQLTTLVIITKGHSTIFTLTRRQISIIFVANDHRPQQKNFRFGRASHVCTALVENMLHRSSTLKSHNNHWISKRLSGIRKSSRLVCKSNSCLIATPLCIILFSTHIWILNNEMFASEKMKITPNRVMGLSQAHFIPYYAYYTWACSFTG